MLWLNMATCSQGIHQTRRPVARATILTGCDFVMEPSCGGHYQYYAYLIKKNGVQMWQSLYDTNDLVAEIMCQLWQEFPPEETWCAWLGTSAECWGDWSCTLDLTTKFTVASAGILVHAPFHPCQVAVTPFGDWVPVDEIYWCSVPGWTALSLAGVIGCQSTVAWWSQQWPPEGNNCVVINIVISLSCVAFVLLPALMFEYIYDVTTAINIFWLDLTWLDLITTNPLYKYIYIYDIYVSVYLIN